MLIVKVFVNREQIDEIMVHRFQGGHGLNHYRIVKPEGLENEIVAHQYSEGYEVLLRKVLDVMVANRPPKKG